MTFSIETLKQLRQETGAGIQDCRKAWIQAGENFAQALNLLQEKAQEAALLRTNRQATQGVIEVYSHGDGRIGVLVEINTETDFAARSQGVRNFAHEVALQIAAAAPLCVRDEDVPDEVLASLAEKASARAHAEGKPERIWPRIVAGMLEKYKDQNVLLRQAYIRDESLTLAQLLAQVAASVRENVVIRRFVRWELNETSDPADQPASGPV